ncbi:MAG: leucyl aminopeptidase [Vicinamibacterales bacterium]
MHSVHQTPALTLVTGAAHDLDADLLLIPAFEDDPALDDPALDAAVGGEMARARERKEFKAEPYEAFGPMPVSGWKTPRLLFVGVGKRADLDRDRLRRLGTTAGLAARQRRASRIALLLPASAVPGPVAVQAVAEGVVLANFDGASYKTKDSATTWLETVQIRIASVSGDMAEALERGRVIGECTNISRSLSNEPGNALTPRVFAERARAVAVAAGVTVDVLDELRIAELKMGLLLGVGQGSSEPPRLIVLRYEPATNLAPDVHLGLVGKGITFDTGGISLKPADKMDRMKDDMSGGAAVIGAMTAIARLGAPVRVTAVIASAENMPGGRALKPGDVITSAEGKTVEVINTDAEGRLVLGDALWYARQQKVTHLVDVATLTGGCVVALGLGTAGLFGTPLAWRDEVLRASERAGDRSWPMPDFDDYMDQLKSDIADFTNQGTRWGSASVGAVFVKEFTGGLPWVHLDIAGPAWAEDAKPYQPKGATGFGVRTLVELALASPSWGKL